MERASSTFRTIQTEAGIRTAVSYEEKRSTERKALLVNARLLREGGICLRGKTLDVSANGLSLLVGDDLRADETCKILFDLPMDGQIHPIEAQAQVAHRVVGSGGVRIGFRFTRLTMSSMIAISRFVR